MMTGIVNKARLNFETIKWNPPKEKPKNIGIYIRLNRRNIIFYSYWNGVFWSKLTTSPLLPRKNQNFESQWQALYWSKPNINAI